MILLRQASRYTYDVFVGQGWDNWSRVRKNHWGLTNLSGRTLAPHHLKSLSKVIMQHPQGSLDVLEP